MAIFGAILVLPGAAFLSYIASDIEQERVELVQSMGRAQAENVAERIDNEILTLQSLLMIFARSGWLEEDALGQLHRRARSALAGQDRYLLVLDEAGQQLVNTRVAFGAPLGLSSDPGALALARGEEGRPVSDFFHGKVAGELVFNVLMRVDLRDGRRRVLILTRNAESLASLVSENTRAAGWNVLLEDQNGTRAFALGPDRDSADASDCTAGGEPLNFSQAIPNADWTVCVQGSDLLVSETPQLSRAMLFGGLAWFAAALLAAFGIGNMLSGAIRQTAKMASGLERGEHPSLDLSPVTEVNEIRLAFLQSSRRLRERDAERRMILNETAHRARNQMSLAVALTNLTAHSCEDVAQMKAVLGQRLRALGRAIDVAESAQSGGLTLAAVAENQLAPFAEDQAGRMAITGEDIAVGRSAGQSMALVFFELATNAQKYGAWSRPEGHVTIDCRMDGTDVRITWTERGTVSAPTPRKGFGTKLIHSILETGFGGSFERTFTDCGMVCVMRVAPSALQAG